MNHPPPRQPRQALVLPPVPAPTAAMQALAMANQDGRPTLAQFFPAGVNPKTGNTYHHDAFEAVRMVQDLLAVEVSPIVKESSILKCKGHLYQLYMQEHGINMAIIKGAYGYDRKYHSDMKSMDSIHATVINNPAELLFYNDVCLKLRDYVFLYIIPSSSCVKLGSIMSKSMVAFNSSVKNPKHRVCHPLWSNDFVESITIEASDTSLCDGHMYEYCLLIDRMLPGLSAIVTSLDAHHLTHAQLVTMFTNVKNDRLYKWKGE